MGRLSSGIRKLIPWAVYTEEGGPLYLFLIYDYWATHFLLTFGVNAKSIKKPNQHGEKKGLFCPSNLVLFAATAYCYNILFVHNRFFDETRFRLDVYDALNIYLI